MTDSQDKRLLKQPGIEQDLLKKELNLPSKALRQATHKEQALIHSFGNKPVDFEKYREEDNSPAPTTKRRSWIRFKLPDEDTDPKPVEPPITKIIKELAPKVLIGIVDAKLPKEEKDALKILFEELRVELQKPDIEWQLVIPILKKTLDYDIKTAALILHLTSACRQIWERERENEQQKNKTTTD